MSVTTAARRPTCQIKWIGTDGQPTPDTSPSVGLIRSTFRTMNARAVAEGLPVAPPSAWFHVCEAHARQMPADWEWLATVE